LFATEDILPTRLAPMQKKIDIEEQCILSLSTDNGIISLVVTSSEFNLPELLHFTTVDMFRMLTSSEQHYEVDAATWSYHPHTEMEVSTIDRKPQQIIVFGL
jgi:hypothetical protein